MPKPVALPSQALDHMSSEAIAHLPAHLVPPAAPILVTDPDITAVNGLTGHAGAADYFIFDLSSTNVRSDEAVYGFESGLDKIVFVNASPAEGPRDTFIPAYSYDSDYSSELAFFSLPDDPAKLDGRVFYTYEAVWDGPFSMLYASVFTVDAVMVGTDVLVYPDNPFAS